MWAELEALLEATIIHTFSDLFGKAAWRGACEAEREGRGRVID